MSRKYDSIIEAIGRTPVVRLDRLEPPNVKLYVKCEAFNPMGSVKDRLALGARVVLTPASDRGTGMLLKAVELAEKHGWFLSRQFENEANADVHSRTTAREILEDFRDEKLDYWATGFGTGGTLKGVARVLKKESPGTRVMVCEPGNSPVLVSGRAEPGSTVLCMLPDTGERYLSTPLFENIAEEMTDEEVELSRSTPNYRFDAPRWGP